jgi:hypothetical protein
MHLNFRQPVLCADVTEFIMLFAGRLRNTHTLRRRPPCCSPMARQSTMPPTGLLLEPAAVNHERHDVDIMRRRMEASVVALIHPLGSGWNTRTITRGW